MTITENIHRIKADLGENISLVAVSKTKPSSDIQNAYDGGQRIFGENKAQEMASKADELPSDIEWHMIGHMQSNKVKYIAPFVSLIHSVDKLSLLKEINKRAKQNERIIKVLLQMHIAKEDTKFGLDEVELENLLVSNTFESFQNIKIVGLMGMATFTDDESRVRNEFAYLKAVFDRLKKGRFGENNSFTVLSMGMSGDYKIAIEEGSNMIRVGSMIFGARNY